VSSLGALGRELASAAPGGPAARRPRTLGARRPTVPVESPIRISGYAGYASATATVEVHVVHTFIGDLVVSLVAPDGSTYVLQDRAGFNPTTSTRPTP
jgi:proprotein convertase P-domain-containing protein